MGYFKGHQQETRRFEGRHVCSLVVGTPKNGWDSFGKPQGKPNPFCWGSDPSLQTAAGQMGEVSQE